MSSAAKLAALGDAVAVGVAAGVDDGEGLNDGVDVGDCVGVSEVRLEGEPCVDTVADADAESLHAAEADGLMDADALPDFVRSSDGARVTADDRDGFGVRVNAVCVDVAVDESVDRKDRVGRLDDELDAEKDRMSGVARPLADAEADGCAEREKLLLPETLADADDDGESRELLEIHDEALVLCVSRGELLTDTDARGEPDGLGEAETDAVVNGETESDADGRADDDSTELPDADADEVTLGEVRGEREADAETDADVVIVGETEADAETDGEWVASGDADTERETDGECVTVGDKDVDRDSAGERVADVDADTEDECVALGVSETDCDADEEADGVGVDTAHTLRSSSQTELSQSLSDAHGAPAPPCSARRSPRENKPAAVPHAAMSNKRPVVERMLPVVKSFVGGNRDEATRC